KITGVPTFIAQFSDDGTSTTLTGRHLKFSADNTYDIGATAAGRPRNVYVAGTLNTPVIAPLANSVTAVQITKADGTTRVLNIDTTNARVGIGTSAPAAAFEVVGDAYVHGASGLFLDALFGYVANV